MKRPKPKYSKRASEKIARTMHEFKRGKLRSSHGDKVASRAQAIAIGLSQARRAGYKVPPQRAHAAMSLDSRVRAYLGNMKPGTEIDARGIARALGGVDPLAADYALESAEREGLAVTSDGRWFGPVGAQTSHARKKQLAREIDAALSQPGPPTIKLKDRHSGGHVWLTVSGGRIIGVMGADPGRYMGMSLDEARHHARYGGRTKHSHATIAKSRPWQGTDANERQVLLWIPFAPKGALSVARPIPVDFTAKEVASVWTLPSSRNPSIPPALPLHPVHGRDAFLEDYGHDWTVRAGNFIYRSRITDQPTWVLVQLKQI